MIRSNIRELCSWETRRRDSLWQWFLESTLESWYRGSSGQPSAQIFPRTCWPKSHTVLWDCWSLCSYPQYASQASESDAWSYWSCCRECFWAPQPLSSWPSPGRQSASSPKHCTRFLSLATWLSSPWVISSSPSLCFLDEQSSSCWPWFRPL